jgi:predicted  nucleic acid-binding Zn-ribbon protein
MNTNEQLLNDLNSNIEDLEKEIEEQNDIIDKLEDKNLELEEKNIKLKDELEQWEDDDFLKLETIKRNIKITQQEIDDYNILYKI